MGINIRNWAGKSGTKTYIAIAVAAVVVLGGYFALRSEPDASRTYAAAVRANLEQVVSVTGTVKPAKDVDLAFEKSGRVAYVGARVGGFVSAGSVLVKLDASELKAQLDKALADLASNQADLEKNELILTNYYESADDTLNDAYTKATDAVREDLDDFFTDDEKNPQLTFGTKDLQIENDIENQRLMVTPELNTWLRELQTLGTSPAELETALAKARVRLEAIRKLMDLALTAVIESTNLSAANVTTYRDNANSGRASVNTALSAAVAAEQSIGTQKATIVSKSASVQSYAASAENIRAQLEKTSLYAPISGTVTKQDAEVGEIITANSVVISIISASEFEIEANIPEADIAKVKRADSANITLDAYGNDIVFEATVTMIDPAATVIDGVPTYKTTLVFRTRDKRIKSGMTANIDIVTATKENALVVPRRAVISKNGRKFVLVDVGEKEPEERAVETGLIGSDGNIEIISGLTEGERIVSSGVQ